MRLLELLGLAAGALTTVSFVPQVLKIWRTREVSAISRTMYSTFCLGVLLWLIFGIIVHSIPLMLTNGVTLLLAGSILYLKITIERHK